MISEKYLLLYSLVVGTEIVVNVLYSLIHVSSWSLTTLRTLAHCHYLSSRFDRTRPETNFLFYRQKVMKEFNRVELLKLRVGGFIGLYENTLKVEFKGR